MSSFLHCRLSPMRVEGADGGPPSRNARAGAGYSPLDNRFARQECRTQEITLLMTISDTRKHIERDPAHASW
jgi:hypothetical protein